MITVISKKHVNTKTFKNQKEEERKVPANENEYITHTVDLLLQDCSGGEP